jgi:hypothetical protein
MTIGPQLGRSPGAAPAGSELAKAQLIDTTTGAAFAVMYNPEELRLEQGNSFAEVGVPGLSSPPLQYVRGKARTLSMELFFDTYASGEDVRGHTGPIVRLLDTLPQTKAPPVLLFSLGRLQFSCVLLEASQRFTMFRRDGTPVRCTMSVRLQEYVRIDVEVRQGLFIGSPTVSAAASAVLRAAARVGPGATGRAGARSAQPALPGPAAALLSGPAAVHVTVRGDTLSALAGSYLGDPARWREIAAANDVEDPLDPPVGVSLVIPGGSRPAGGRA